VAISDLAGRLIAASGSGGNIGFRDAGVTIIRRVSGAVVWALKNVAKLIWLGRNSA
jgi:hypothetical protein